MKDSAENSGENSGEGGRWSNEQARSPRRRVLRVASAMLLTLIALLSVATGIGYWMWQGEPEYWQAVQSYFEQADEQELAEMAEAAENRTLQELSSPAPSSAPAPASGRPAALREAEATRTLHLSYQWINAWLAYRLEPWLANQDAAMPEVIDRPMVTTNRGHLVLAFKLQLPEPEVNQVLSVVFDVEVLEDGRARLVWQRTFAGRLPLPSQWVKQQVVGRVAEQAGVEGERPALRALRQVLDGEPFDPLMDIDSTRRARLVGLDVGEAGVDLTWRIEPRPRTSAAPPRPETRMP